MSLLPWCHLTRYHTTWHQGSSFRVLPLCVGMKREEATHHKSTPNEVPSWELCKYFHPLPQPADRLIPLTFLINHWGVERGWDRRNWISGHWTVVGNCSHQHPVCNPILSFYHTHIKGRVCAGQVKIAILMRVSLFLFLCHDIWPPSWDDKTASPGTSKWK